MNERRAGMERITVGRVAIDAVGFAVWLAAVAGAIKLIDLLLAIGR